MQMHCGMREQHWLSSGVVYIPHPIPLLLLTRRRMVRLVPWHDEEAKKQKQQPLHPTAAPARNSYSPDQRTAVFLVPVRLSSHVDYCYYYYKERTPRCHRAMMPWLLLLP